MILFGTRLQLVFACAALAALTYAGPFDGLSTPASAQAPAAIDPTLLEAYRWRGIGPNRGGRSIAVSGVKGRPREAYFGAVGGGLWKTTDAGNNWAPVTDGQITSSSVGAVAVSESNPDIVYIGMGENCIRGNIMPGDGVYKSVDGGQKWAHVGFRNSDAISKIRIHPTNPDIVFVASFGLYYGPSEERGVFKSTDGGTTWKRTLFKDAKSGAVDIVIDATNPNVIYAALWEAYRIEYQMSSGGPGSGLYKSTDGGETWTEITRNPGMPSGVVGRIGVANTKADSNRVYALVENEHGGLFVSDDAGASWQLVNTSRSVRQRAFYYTHVFGDPSNKDVVYMQNTSLFRSTDGGKTTVQVGQNTHGDHHDLWVDPDDALHVVDGNDGGGAITYNINAGVPSWSDQDFPTAQWYHVITTAHLPFHVCGSQQDNSTLCVPSNTNAGGGGGNPPVAPYQVGGGEPGYIAPHATDPDVFFGGTNNGSFLTRLNRRTGEFKEVGAYPRFFSGENSAEVKERWQWTYPIIFSYVDPNVLYTSSQRVWKTTNGGDTWEAISGDLSRHDPRTMGDSGGPITHDMNSPEIYGTVFSLAPGKKDINVIWAGSDDGLVHVTRDHGTTWTNVTPAAMPDLGRVSQLDGSSFDHGTAYMAVKKMLLGDRSPYIFRTKDYGRTWTKIVTGIPADDYVHTVREDPVRRGLLYAGTQHGVYLSYDDGEQWLKFAHGLPDVPVTDLVVEDNALAIGTHGRSFYVMDDIAALRQFGLAPLTDVTVFKPANATRGLDRPIVTYYLKAQPKSLTIDFLNARGEVVRSVDGVPPRPAGEAPADGGGGRSGGPQAAPMAAGMNRFTWDLNSTGVVTFPGMILWGATQNGPAVLPGSYRVRLTADGVTQTQPFTVLKHPLRPVSDADLQFQWDLASRIRDKVNEANLAVIKIRRIKTDIADRIKDAPAEVRSAGEQLAKALSAVEEDVYQVKNQSGQDPLNFPIKTNNRLASLLRVAVFGEGRPTGNVEPIFNDLIAELKAETNRLDQTIADQLPPFNNMLTRLKKDPIKQ
ncbi:MAG: glycosyl hydrolase [Acidobacteriota bacterium]|nr:glycosyl hydrolase [Acidobacteriota bacterium]